VSGLTGGTLVLQDDYGAPLTITANGPFTFAPLLGAKSPYNVTVQTEPPGQLCYSPNGYGQVNGANVTSISVACTANAPGQELGPASSNGEDAQLGYDINAATGNLFLYQQDIQAHPALGPTLSFVRYYNSQANGRDVGLGPNWSHSFSWAIAVTADQASIYTDTGKVLVFTYSSSLSTWMPSPGEFGSLIATGRPGVTWPPKVGASGSLPNFVYTTKFGTSYSFDGNGRLTTIQPPDNYAITVNYSKGNQISTVTSGVAPGNLTLAFSYSGGQLCVSPVINTAPVGSICGGHISSVVDPAGTKWVYGYTPMSLGVTLGQSPMLAQSGNGLLQTVSVSSQPQNMSPKGPLQIPIVLRLMLYSYVPQELGGETFSPGTVAAQLTGYGMITSMVQSSQPTVILNHQIVEAVVGLFNYSNPSAGTTAVSEAASGIVSNRLVKDVKLTYTISNAVHGWAPTITTLATLNGGSKTIVSTPPVPGFPRIVSISSTAGSGAFGESVAEKLSWNSNLTLQSSTDGNGVLSTFGPYDAHGNPLSITEASGTPQARVTTFTYHPVLSRPLSVSVPSVDGISGHQHTIVWDYDCDYDQNYNLDPTLSNYVHQIVESGYTAPGLTGTVDDPESHVIQIKYAGTICGGVPVRNGADQIINISGPQVPFGSPPYNPAYNYTAAQTTFDYSASTGYLAHINRIVGNGAVLTTSLSTYDADGRLSVSSDPNGNIKKTTYDVFGAISTAETDSADGGQTSLEQYIRDMGGNLLKDITPEGIATQMEYDSALRPWRRSGVTAGGSTIWSSVIDLDAFGFPVTVRKFAGSGQDEGAGCTAAGAEQLCKEFAYDSYERVVSVHSLDPNTDATCGGSGVALNCTTYYTYDGNGNLLTVGDLTNGVSTFTRDLLGRTVSYKDKIGALTSLQYDTNDRLIFRRDPMDPQNGGNGANGRVTTYLYDDFGRVVLVSSPDIGRWLSVYDLAGNLSSSEDSRGAVLNYIYDGLYRRTMVKSPLPNESVSFVYDETGAIAATSSGPSPVSFANSRGRLTSVQASDSTGNRVWDHFVYDYRGWTTSEIRERANVFGAYIAATTYSWGANHELRSLTYPDRVVASYQYPSPNAALYAPVPLPSEIDTSLNQRTNVMASSISYSSDGGIQALQYGSGSSLNISRNKRGEITEIMSGPTATPIMQQTYVYDPNVTEQVNAVNFFPGQQNSWNWTLGYTRVGELQSYSTTVRTSPSLPSGDNYSWTYDLVGNRTAESYNGQTRLYCYDSCNSPSLSNHLTMASGGNVLNAANASSPGTVIGYMELTYDSNGNVSSDNIAYNSNNQGVLFYGFLYNTRHHLSEINQSTGYLGGGQLQPYIYQQNVYDGLDRISEIVCPNQPGTQGSFGFCSQTAVQSTGTTRPQNGVVSGTPCTAAQWQELECFSNGQALLCAKNGSNGNTYTWVLQSSAAAGAECPTGSSSTGSNSGASTITPCPTLSTGASPTWAFFYYDRSGRILEELQNNNIGAYGYPTYDVTDHIYLGGMEVGRAILQYQNNLRLNGLANSCTVNQTQASPSDYKLALTDIQYLHHDNRNALVAVESQNNTKHVPNLPKLVWEAEISPFGQAITIGVRGADGKIGSAEHLNDDIVSPGVGGSIPSGLLGSFLVVPGEADPSAGRSLSPTGNLWFALDGGSAYVGGAGATGPGGIGSGDHGATSSSPVNSDNNVTSSAVSVRVPPQDGGIQPMELLDWSERSVQTYKTWINAGAAWGWLFTRSGNPATLTLRGVLGETLAGITAVAAIPVYTSIALGSYRPPVYYNYNTSLISQWIFPSPASMANSLASGANTSDILDNYYGGRTAGLGSNGYSYSGDLPPADALASPNSAKPGVDLSSFPYGGLDCASGDCNYVPPAGTVSYTITQDTTFLSGPFQGTTTDSTSGTVTLDPPPSGP
jgi:YD repeat-containing protein